MNAGYVRLSRDDDKRNYVSIENQKLIINQYAAEQGLVIDRWYEDDGVSGYVFDRPGFMQMMEDLNKDIDTVFVKDFSRLGRHNAKVLLLLDEFQESGKHLIVIDDHYDSNSSDDDTIGIKTWYNERYVKDTSRKIKSAIGARQKEGTLHTLTPFGYRRLEKNKDIIEVIPSEAEHVKLVYKLYIDGAGYRKIANYLTEKCIPTPSMVHHQHELEAGRMNKRKVAEHWSDGMVKELLDNDFYIGTLRLRKRARSTIHGKDKRIPKEEQFIFENNHPAIIDKATFDLVQDMKEKRNRNHYRGSHGQWTGTEILNPFSSCLYCKDCGSRLTPIKRKTSSNERKYYICSTYNTKGVKHCAKAHTITEADLMADVLTYIKLCRNALCEVIAGYDLKDFEADKKSVAVKKQELLDSIAEKKAQLKVLFSQKVKDLANAAGNEDIINETYGSLQDDILANIHGLELQLTELNDTKLESPAVKEKLKSALDVADKIIAGGTLDRRDIELLIERINVDADGFPDIQLKYGLSGLITYSPAAGMNRRENTIIALTMKLVQEETREFTSVKYLAKKLTELGFAKNPKNVMPYVELLKEQGIIKPTDCAVKPFSIEKTKEEIQELILAFLPDLTADAASESISNDYLHLYDGGRRNAGNGI